VRASVYCDLSKHQAQLKRVVVSLEKSEVKFLTS